MLLAHPSTDLETVDAYSKTLEMIGEERGHGDIVNAVMEEKMRRFAQERLHRLRRPKTTVQMLETQLREGREVLARKQELKRRLELRMEEFQRMEEEIIDLKHDVLGEYSSYPEIKAT